jgi:hypothetical protein
MHLKQLRLSAAGGAKSIGIGVLPSNSPAVNRATCRKRLTGHRRAEGRFM